MIKHKAGPLMNKNILAVYFNLTGPSSNLPNVGSTDILIIVPETRTTFFPKHWSYRHRYYANLGCVHLTAYWKARRTPVCLLHASSLISISPLASLFQTYTKYKV